MTPKNEGLSYGSRSMRVSTSCGGGSLWALCTVLPTWGPPYTVINPSHVCGAMCEGLLRCRKSSPLSPPAHDEYFNYTGCDDFNLYYKKHLPDDHHNVSASADSFQGCDTILLPLTSTPSKTKTEPGPNLKLILP
ncbi:uncharacterized protein LOC127805961 isoform X2 [Diospyros lotus]|uniref:uncharacterized protein LOC127805961 isoform X2 n=1 Tax=Diospyros lotus TaxID=55363 RepID=UPI002253DD05|nr:uncharacterized protein LOC127805961 isoform X2 [Diospyros lotus]XP_052198785.1 uncharacterized protein LOC127805961 isoform X2 [Diospyros lotus]XP_052198786.1 uncharacterized protein LOC127805961 isoform X2 [Diospyros lotus]XP_052198787.1 uncharacterized protein LOC127805961 isoform X2 [Diospyros lotus]